MANDFEKPVVRRSRGLERAFAILDCLSHARRPMRPNEIATTMGAPRSTIYELTSILIDLNVLEPIGGDGRLYLGPKMMTFGAAYADGSDLLQRAADVLDVIVEKTRETTQYCMLEGDKYTVALMREGSRPFRISSSVGELTPIPWTASGRLLLDHMSDDEIVAFIPPEDFRLPSGEMLNPGDFLAEVRQAKRDNYFTFDSIVDSFTHCFAVPVRRPDGVAVSTLCLVAPKEDALKNRSDYLESLQEMAERLSRHIPNDLSGPSQTRTGR